MFEKSGFDAPAEQDQDQNSNGSNKVGIEGNDLGMMEAEGFRSGINTEYRRGGFNGDFGDIVESTEMDNFEQMGGDAQ